MPNDNRWIAVSTWGDQRSIKLSGSVSAGRLVDVVIQ